jgi:hypothetical protein
LIKIKGENMEIPRLNTEYVQKILKSEEKTIEEKSRLICMNNYNMLCLEYDGKIPSHRNPSVEQIKASLEEYYARQV